MGPPNPTTGIAPRKMPGRGPSTCYEATTRGLHPVKALHGLACSPVQFLAQGKSGKPAPGCARVAGTVSSETIYIQVTLYSLSRLN